jgi:hypothetical protein
MFKVHESKQPVSDPPKLWHALLRDQYVLAYEDEQGIWYDWHPLLEKLRVSSGNHGRGSSGPLG